MGPSSSILTVLPLSRFTDEVSVRAGIRAEEKGEPLPYTSPGFFLPCSSVCGRGGGEGRNPPTLTHAHCFYFHSSYRSPLWASLSSSAKIKGSGWVTLQGLISSEIFREEVMLPGKVGACVLITHSSVMRNRPEKPGHPVL